MKVLVSTRKTQGTRKNDFCWVPEGEILKFGFACDNEAVDGECGCRRAMVGIHSSRATTTIRVAERKGITEKKLALLILASLERDGWTKMAPAMACRRGAVEDAKEIIRIASKFSTGSVIEKRGDVFMCRVSGKTKKAVVR